MDPKLVHTYRALWAKACEAEKEDLHNCKETAKLIGCEPIQVRRLVSYGQLVPVGRRQHRLQFTREEIERYLATRQKDTA